MDATPQNIFSLISVIMFNLSSRGVYRAFEPAKTYLEVERLS